MVVKKARGKTVRRGVKARAPSGQSAKRPTRPATRPALSETRQATRSPSLKERLEQEIGRHARTRAQLKLARAHQRRRTQECDELKTCFEIAFRGANIYAFAQDRELRYTWIAGRDEARARMFGRTDDELWPEQQSLIALKRRVLETGVPEDGEVSFITPERRALFAVHVDPLFAADGTIEGIMSTAVDISRIRSLESEQRRLTDDLATTAQRYEFALRGSNVTVFTQDPDFRYTSVSKPLFGHDPGAIHGKTDAELLSEGSAAALMALKREVLQKGEPRDAELRIEDGAGTRWYDFHFEPMRDVSGSLIGLTGAAVDVTERKQNEAHLRLLMRELTHRSKNLLAVIQAMARQSARHTGSVQAFLEHFSARVQALARSHDLLVQESWRGASLGELVRLQLSHYLDRDPDQVSIDGPDIRLKPEAAQSLGLALHELAANALKHGAWSHPKGHVAVTWSPLVDGEGVELWWRESGGPKVEAPKRRGFGSIVIEHNLTRALDAEVSLDFVSDGLTCRVAVPKNQLVAQSA